MYIKIQKNSQNINRKTSDSLFNYFLIIKKIIIFLFLFGVPTLGKRSPLKTIIVFSYLKTVITFKPLIIIRFNDVIINVKNSVNRLFSILTFP